MVRRRGKGRPGFDPARSYGLRYRAQRHRNYPHIVKFSGGRSSGMLLCILLENGILDADRGDVVVFNNTSAEHPDTYRFVRDCMRVSHGYGVPFFWVEFQTYEDVRGGEWTRLDSYRLVNHRPKSPDNPDGFHWRGEVFEEMLSWSGYVPNQFSRACTKNMKLETTRAFLADWLACKEGIDRLGHYGNRSRVDADDLYRRHLRNRGEVPRDIFLRKREFALNRPHVRPQQRYADYSSSWREFDNAALEGTTFGNQASFGGGGAQYLAFVGLRGDERLRVERVRARNDGPAASGHQGEHVYMPLADMRVSRNDVNAFWNRQNWDLALPGEGVLSNCVYCFLKGGANLRLVHSLMEEEKSADAPGFGSLVDTPCDFDWWTKVERKYGRDLVAEGRKVRNKDITHLGFSGHRGLLFEQLAEKIGAGTSGTHPSAHFENAPLPCDCTE